MHRFDNPARAAALSPENTLIRIGLKRGDVFCDIGAGTGIFTLPAAIITGAATYAADISDEMLQTIDEKCAAQGIGNVMCVKPADGRYPIPDNSCDFVMLCAVFHEIDDKMWLLGEIRRMLKKDGKLSIIEFYKKETPHGPPVSHRISEQETIEIVTKNGFNKAADYDLEDQYYLVIFTQ